MSKNRIHPLLNNYYFAGLLFIGWITIGFSTYKIGANFKKNSNYTQHRDFERVMILFQAQMNSYIYGLQGIAGIYHVKRFHPLDDDLKKYALSRNNYQNFKGSKGFGFIRKVKRKDLSDYLARQKRENPSLKFQQLELKNENDLFIIESIEPYETNHTAIGLDVGSEIVRREAVVESYQAAGPAISDVIQLVQVKTSEPSYLIFLPIYQTPKVPPFAERYNQLVGMAYTPIQASSIEKFISSSIILNYKLNIKSSKKNEFLIHGFDEIKNPPQISTEVNLIGKKWIIQAYFEAEKNTAIFTWSIYLLALLLILIYSYIMLGIRNILIEKSGIISQVNKIEAWLKTVMNNIPLSIITTDTNGIIQSINSVAEKMLGYSSSELVGKLTPEIIHDPKEIFERSKILSMELDRDVETGFETFVAKARLGKEDINEWSYVRKDHTRLPVRLIVSLLKDENEQLIGFIEMAEDITEIKKLEKMLDDQRQTMIEATRLSSLGEMAGGIAHEINTPLAIISAKVSQLIRKITSGSIDEHKLSEDLQIINQTTHRISKIINGLRALSRESENDPMKPYSAELSITNALDLCFEKFRNHQVHISTSLIPKIYYLGRSTQLSQVILNLLNNAFDAIEACTDKWIKIEMQTTDNILMIFITDSGPSIDPAVVAKMMFPFFTTKSVGKGTGLGLSISKGIIEKHGGKLYYDQNSCNTKFVIELPLLIGDNLE